MLLLQFAFLCWRLIISKYQLSVATPRMHLLSAASVDSRAGFSFFLISCTVFAKFTKEVFKV